MMTAANRECTVPPPWESLPIEVLGRCLRSGPGPQDHAPFATCKAFARALLSSAKEPSLIVYVDDCEPALARVLQWTTEWNVSFWLDLRAAVNNPAASLHPLLQLLQQECTCLPKVARMYCEDVLLDVCAPVGLEAVFPNLKLLEAKDCPLPSVQLPLAGCSNLKQLNLCASPTQSRADWLPQLQQLSTLSSLASLTIESIHEYPTSFLPLLEGQLTQLWLVNTPGQHWTQASMQHAAQLTQLHKLVSGGSRIPAQRLGMLTTLRQLQHLTMDFYGNESQPGDSDLFVSTALQFPHLTYLSVGSLHGLQQSYTEQPCSWKQLRLSDVSPQELGRLPLHSLTHPLQLGCIHLEPSTPAADIQAAVHNLARSAAPTTCSWLSNRDLIIVLGDADSIGQQASSANPVGSQAAAALRAAAPLVPQNIKSLEVEYACVDAELIAALQQAVPATATTIHINHCLIQRSFWSQLARSFPQLQLLKVSHPSHHHTAHTPCTTAALMAYFCAAAHQRGLAGMQPQAASVKLQLQASIPSHMLEDASQETIDSVIQHYISTQRDEAEGVNEHLQLLGFSTPGGSPTTVQIDFGG